MRIYARFNTLRRADLGEELYGRLVDIYPEGVLYGNRSIKACFDAEDPQYHKYINALRDADWVEWDGNPRSPRRGPYVYQRSVWCEYEESDYDGFEYFGIGPVPYKPLEDAYVADDENETICIELGGLDRQRGDDIASAEVGRTNILVPDHVMRVLEKADLIGVGFTDVRLVDAEGYAVSWYDHEPEAWWELRSPLQLPPVSSKTTLIDPAGSKPLPPGSEGPALMRGPLGKWAIYTPEALASLEPFDMAHTYERGSRHVHSRNYIVSKRFCDVLKANNIKFHWAPVYIENE